MNSRVALQTATKTETHTHTHKKKNKNKQLVREVHLSFYLTETHEDVDF